MSKYTVLDKVNSPKDVKKLSQVDTLSICTEICDFLVENVSKTGGHLAPNLGVIELTVAIHKVFDTEKDRLIFDVGHQSYVHKILTGRKNKFDTLRQKDGLSGFTKPSESQHDAFISGHASMSISAALGMAHARTLKNQNHDIIAVIGDGALTGGMAYEALNNAGSSKEPLIVILNDNDMSITQNVGAVSKHLLKLRTNKQYIGTKKYVQKILKKSKIGLKVYEKVDNIKERTKRAILDTTFFEQMGLVYLGPIDGHNLCELTEVLNRAKDLKKPVLVHVLTKKGNGYKFSEESPDVFHGIAPFDVKTGKILSKSEHNYSQKFGESLLEFAENDEKICAITAAMSSSTGLTEFSKKYSDRFFDVGIAEAHAVTMSAGLAISGIKPVCVLYSTFLQRAYDQLIHDVSLEKLHIVFGIDRAGIVGDDGETHNGVFDVPMLLSIPNFTIFAPSNYIEQKNMLKKALNDYNSPVAIRYPRGSQGEFIEDTSNCDYKLYNPDGKVLIITYGHIINNVLKLIESDNVAILKVNNLLADISNVTDKFDEIIFVEDCVNTGSYGMKISSNLRNKSYVKLLNSGDKFTKQASVNQVYDEIDITAERIRKYIKEALINE